MSLRFAMISLMSLALAGCSAQNLSPLQHTNAASESVRSLQPITGAALQSHKILLQWSPVSIKLRDGGPYVATTLTYSAGYTVVVSYDHQCSYRVEFDLHPGPVKHNLESDGYDFYAYSGKVGQPPFHCTVPAKLKDAGGHVVARSGIAITITYPKKHGHGG